jgi:HEPN domain-containing protein
MTAPREAVLRKVRQWVKYAEEDLRLAEQALGMPDPPYRLIAYHAQQCAEKYLKAFLVLNGVDFPYTHNILVLLGICRPLAEWAGDLVDAGRLSAYAVTARYPGLDDGLTEEDASAAIALARRVRQTVRAALGQEGLELGP